MPRRHHVNLHAERSIREHALPGWVPSREQRRQDRQRAAERAARRLARHSLVILRALARPWARLLPAELALRWALERRQNALAWRALAELMPRRPRR